MHYLCAVLHSHPAFALLDFTKPFHIESNASDTTVGGVFTQENASIHKPIAFLCKILASSETIVFVTTNCLQSLLIAKLSAPTLMGNKLQSLLIKNLLFTSTINFYSIKGKLNGLKPLLILPFKSPGGLVLPLWFLILYLGILPWTPLAAPPFLLPYPLQPWIPFW